MRALKSVTMYARSWDPPTVLDALMSVTEWKSKEQDCRESLMKLSGELKALAAKARLVR